MKIASLEFAFMKLKKKDLKKPGVILRDMTSGLDSTGIGNF